MRRIVREPDLTPGPWLVATHLHHKATGPTVYGGVCRRVRRLDKTTRGRCIAIQDQHKIDQVMEGPGGLVRIDLEVEPSSCGFRYCSTRKLGVLSCSAILAFELEKSQRVNFDKLVMGQREKDRHDPFDLKFGIYSDIRHGTCANSAIDQSQTREQVRKPLIGYAFRAPVAIDRDAESGAVPTISVPPSISSLLHS